MPSEKPADSQDILGRRCTCPLRASARMRRQELSFCAMTSFSIGRGKGTPFPVVCPSQGRRDSACYPSLWCCCSADAPARITLSRNASPLMSSRRAFPPRCPLTQRRHCPLTFPLSFASPRIIPPFKPPLITRCRGNLFPSRPACIMKRCASGHLISPFAGVTATVSSSMGKRRFPTASLSVRAATMSSWRT